MRFVRPLCFLILIFAAAEFATPVLAWGQKGHDLVTSGAIKLLPEAIRPFYKKNSRFIISLDVLPDTWKDTHKDEEGAHHFIDLEFYSAAPGFSDIPRSFRQAEKRYGRQSMLKWGVLPWAVMERCNRLSAAFRKKDLVDIVVQSSLLSHYCADMHVPFHVTRDYDGRKPEQKGLHHRFEIDLVERFVRPKDVSPRGPAAVSDPWRAILSWMNESHSALDALNEADEKARISAGAYNEVYFDRFAKAAQPIAAQQLSLGASRLAGLYIWAWTKAGKPPLPSRSAPLFWGR